MNGQSGVLRGEIGHDVGVLSREGAWQRTRRWPQGGKTNSNDAGRIYSRGGLKIGNGNRKEKGQREGSGVVCREGRGGDKMMIKEWPAVDQVVTPCCGR